MSRLRFQLVKERGNSTLSERKGNNKYNLILSNFDLKVAVSFFVHAVCGSQVSWQEEICKDEGPSCVGVLALQL